MSVKKEGDLSNGLPPDELSGGGDPEPRPAGLDRATELKLIDATLLDNINAFSELFEHYRPALYGLCCRRLNDFALAEDVVQEVFLKAFKNLPNSDYRKPIWPWLAAIAHRMCIDLQRRRSLIHYSGDIRLTMDEDAETNGHGHAESALDAVIASEDRVALWKSLEVLPARQRRAFVLYEVDGLSCAEIAAAEGISVGAVKLLLFRARKKMRSVHSGPLPAIVFPVTWLRWKLQQIEERVRPLLSVYSEGFASVCMQAACLGTVAMMVIATGHPTESLGGADPLRSVEAVLSATQSQPGLTGSPNIVAPAKVPTQPQFAAGANQSAAAATGSLNDVINPSENVTPEKTWFSSIMASPNYENDHTILASGQYGSLKVLFSALFTSRDGGASWRTSSSRLRFGENVILSPSYPQDQRIFALGTEYWGLQQSDDGGEIFRTVSPVYAGSFAIPPLFGKGDSRVLLAANTLLEYDAGTGVTLPARLSLALSYNGGYSSVTFSPAYASDQTLFIGDRYAGADPLGSHRGRNILYRCKGLTCDETLFPFDAPLRLRLSPNFAQDNLAYVFSDGNRFVTGDNSHKLLMSNDGAKTFREVGLSLLGQELIMDLAVLRNPPSEPTLFAYASRNGLPVVYRSVDGGRSWTSSHIDVPGFGFYYENKLVATPTGRLLAAGQGIACSIDLGLTWARRCPPEK